jgi:N6-adenosine-specific RNA methylase IME4
MTSPSEQRYRTIVADPPWPMSWSGGGRTRRKGDGTLYLNRGGNVRELPYARMSIEQICAERVPADDEAHLYLWTTDEHLLDGSAARVVRAWGFAARRTIVWSKPNGGQGHGWRPSHELVVLAVRGGLPFNDVNLPTVGRWKQPYVRSGGSVAKLHSGKPDGFLDAVEAASPGPYLEMFARRARFGWDYHGDESLGTASGV